jgi:hypothetical protein
MGRRVFVIVRGCVGCVYLNRDVSERNEGERGGGEGREESGEKIRFY